MVINGSFAQPQISNTFQPGAGNAQVGTAQQQPRPEQAQPAKAPAAESQRSEEQRLVRAKQEDERQKQTAIAASRARGQASQTDESKGENYMRGQLLNVSA